MKVTVKVPTEVELTHVEITLPIMYGEEDIPNDFPLRSGDTWRALVEIDTGRILFWPEGRAERMFVTVKDTGTYRLMRPTDLPGKWQVFAERHQDYVPHGLIPGEYGDVVELHIGADGVIANWPKKPDLSAFFPEDSE